MPIRKKPIGLSEHDDRLLRAIYVQYRIPRDQYKRRPEDLEMLTETFNRLSGRSDSGADLIHYIQTKQKAKRRLKVPWPTFNGDHKRAPAVSGHLTSEQMEALREAYQAIVLPLSLGVDALVWNEEVADALAAEFTRRTGRIVPGLVLIAIAEEKRKRKLWFKVGRQRPDLGEDFGDLDKIEEK